MNTKEKWETTVTIMDPERAARWSAVFPDAKMPIKSIIAETVKSHDGEDELVYWLDVDALSEDLTNRLKTQLRNEFEAWQIELAFKHGISILVENTIATSSDVDAFSEELWREYAPPECQCKGNPMAQMLCSFGHMTECHYPMTCEEAHCSHYEDELSFGDVEDVP